MDQLSSGCCLPRGRDGPSTPNARSNHGGFQGVTARRGCTDVVFLAFFIVFSLALGYGLYYAIARGDLNRLFHGHDRNGDMCGHLNERQESISGSGQNNIAFPYLLEGTCVTLCPDNWVVLLNRCVMDLSKLPKDATRFFEQVATDFELCWREVVYLCLIAFALSFVMTVLFRFCAGLVIWCLLGVIVIGSLGGSAFLWWLWYSWYSSGHSGAITVLAFAVLASFIAFMACTVVFVMRRRVELVVALFNEAGKAIHAMPLLLVQPLWTLLELIFICALWIYTAAWIESAGIPYREGVENLQQQITNELLWNNPRSPFRNMSHDPSLAGVTIENPLSAIDPIIKDLIDHPAMDRDFLVKSIEASTMPDFLKSYILNVVEHHVRDTSNISTIRSIENYTRFISGYLPRLPSHVYFKKDPYLEIVRWHNIFAAMWVSQICLAVQNLIVAGAVAQWFFTRDKSKLMFPIVTSTTNAFFYHLGSAAFGSFVISVLNLVIWILRKAERKMRANAECCSILACFKCCCWPCIYAFKKFLQFVTTHAYIEIAIYGDGFCTSAGRAVRILANNGLRIIAINSVGDFVLRLGKIGVVAATVFIGTELMKGKPGVVYFWAPLLVVAAFACLIAHAFISIYEMVIDTIFICFCEDCEMNDGVQRPYFMSRGLMEFVERSRKVLKPKHQQHQRQANVMILQEPPVVQQQPGLGFDNVIHGNMMWNQGVPPPSSPYHLQPSAPSFSYRC